MTYKKLRSLICAGLIGSSALFAGTAEAGIVTDRFPVQMYAENRVNTYSYAGAGSPAGYASGQNDLIRILGFQNGWLHVQHPGSGGRTVDRWCKANELFADPNYGNRSAHVNGYQTVYRTSTSGTNFGSVNNEDVIVMAERNNRALVLYRLNNGQGFKAGWIQASAVPNNNNRNLPSSRTNPMINTNVGRNPEGWFDVVSSNANNQITVRGWALDRDNVNTQIDVHVYVGGGAGSGAPAYSVKANTYRPDVEQALHGVGNYHGFETTLNVPRTGNQSIHVYAINIMGGDNVELQGSPKNVTIKSNSQTSSNSDYLRWTGTGNKIYDDKVRSFMNEYAYQPGNSEAGLDCGAYANAFVKYVYGLSQARQNDKKYENPDQIQSGDVLHVNAKGGKNAHWIVVLSRHGNNLTTIEGNWWPQARNGKGQTVYSESQYYIQNNKLYRRSEGEFRQWECGFHYL